MQSQKNHHQASGMTASRPPNKRGRTTSEMEAPPPEPTDHLVFKNRLLELAQKLAFSPPIFLTINEGSSYAPKFRITVLVNGMRFTSKSQHSSPKLAEQDASRIAYESIIGKEEKGSQEAKTTITSEFQSLPGSSKPPNNSVGNPSQKEPPSEAIFDRFIAECTSSAKQETARNSYESVKGKANVEGYPSLYQNPIYCKSILHEYAVKTKMRNPKYETKCKPTFLPRFVSWVDFNGEVYIGEEAESKKQAEQLAAQAAIKSLLGTLGPASRSLFLIIKAKEIIFDTSSAPKHLHCVEHEQLLPPIVDGILAPIPSPRPLVTGRGRPGPTFEQQRINQYSLTTIKQEDPDQANTPVRQKPVVSFTNHGPGDPRIGAKRKADKINWTHRKRK